jgi:hypothetical protein
MDIRAELAQILDPRIDCRNKRTRLYALLGTRFSV